MEYTKEKNRIWASGADGQRIAEVTFPARADGAVEIDQTFVDDSLRGQGIAAELMAEAYSAIKEDGLKAVLTCPYAIKWFAANPDKHDILAQS